MKMSKILVATGRGKEVRKMVRNQEEAYMEVWKLWAWKCMCSSGSCSCEAEIWIHTVITVDSYTTTVITRHSMRCLPGSYTRTGTCRVPARPYWVWRALVICSLASISQTHRKPLLLASGRNNRMTSNLADKLFAGSWWISVLVWWRRDYYLHEQQSYNEGTPLTIANLTVNQRICLRELALDEFRWGTRAQVSARVKTNGANLHDVEEHFLAQAVFLLEEFVFGVSPCDVPANQLLAGRRHLQEFGVLILDGHILGVAQQLPHYCPKVVRDPFSDKILRKKKRTETLWNWY